MTHSYFLRGVRIAALVALGLVLTTTAHAQTARFISATGNDANECTRAAPCRTLQRGIDDAPARGVVHILDSGTYGQSLTIAKSINVVATGVAATIGQTIINAPDATIGLRGLHITGRNNTGFSGALIVANASSVYIEDCDVEGAGSTAATAMNINLDNGFVTITGSTFRDARYGILITTSSDNSQVVIENSRFLNNSDAGIHNVGPGTEASIERSVLAGNGAGLSVQNGATVRISNSTVVNNASGLVNNGGDPGTLLTRGNNMVHGNTTPTSGTITPLAGM
jgi:nitrous oxidase accessory protein NosD